MGLHVTPRSSVSGGSERGRDGSSQMVEGGVESIRVSDSFFTALALSCYITHRTTVVGTDASASTSVFELLTRQPQQTNFFWNQLLFLLFFWYCHFNNLNVSEICVCESDLVFVCVTVTFLRKFD